MSSSFVPPSPSNALTQIVLPTGPVSASPTASTVPLKVIDQRSDVHQFFELIWRDIETLYQGGAILKAVAERFLLMRPKEMPEVYKNRLKGFTYHNLMLLGVGYYGSKLFEKDPEVDLKLGDVAIEPPEDSAQETEPGAPDDVEAAAWDFYVETFLADCDGGRTSFVNFFKDILKYWLLYKEAYVLIDLPKGTQDAQSLADQNIRPLLKLYGPSQVINKQVDERGNLDWILIKVESWDRQFLKAPVKVIRWHYYDRKEFKTYEWREDTRTTDGSTNNDSARMIDTGPHSMSDYEDDETGEVTGRVPVHVMAVADEFWIAHRVFLPLRDHLNVDNTYSFALKQGNLAMPVITSDTEYQPQLVDAGFIALPPGATFNFAEPSGTSYQRSQERIDRLREEIFRLMHLQAQGKSSTASASAQSGYSKEQDMAPAQDVLCAMGDLIRTNMQIILYLVAAIRKDRTMNFDVRGFDFGDDEVLPDIEAVAALQALRVRSELFARECEKGLVRRYGKDWNPELVKQIEAEIDSAPSLEEIAQAEQDQEEKMLLTKMQASANRLITKPQD